MSETIEAKRKEVARLRAAASIAWDFYRADECRVLNAQAWAIQEEIEALARGTAA